MRRFGSVVSYEFPGLMYAKYELLCRRRDKRRRDARLRSATIVSNGIPRLINALCGILVGFVAIGMATPDVGLPARCHLRPEAPLGWIWYYEWAS